MRKVFMVLAGALIALPIFAEQKKPTVTLTPAANRQQQKAEKPIVGWKTPTKTRTPGGAVPPTWTPTKKNAETTPTATPTKKNPDITPTRTPRSDTTATPTRVANRSINLNSGRSNRVVQPTVTPTP